MQLDALLDGNDAKPKRERLTLIRIYEELRALGYEGSYDAIRRYAKIREKARGAAMAEAYVPLFYNCCSESFLTPEPSRTHFSSADP